MATGLDVCGHLSPVVDPGVQNADLIPIEVFRGEDLDVAQAAIDSVLAKTPEHEGKETANKQQSSDTSADHDQGHEGAAPVAEDISKG